jgi:prepilin-type N-terminal cleavage/methylation domain-containing protein
LRHFKKSKGFSLIEVLIALVILSISLLALAGLMVTTTRNNSFGGHLTEAVTFAQQRLEELRVAPYNTIVTPGAPVIQTGVPSGTNYTINWNVVQNADDSLRRVTMTVNWNDGTAHSISIVTVVKNPTAGI